MMERYTGTQPVSAPQVGMLLAYQHQVLRIVAVRTVPDVDWTDEERRKVAAFAQPQRAEPGPVILVTRPVEQRTDAADGDEGERHFRYLSSLHGPLAVFDDEHYPVCAACGQPMPCQETLAAREAQRALTVAERYSDPARCPCCGDWFGPRQHTRTFETNGYLPAGPPVTFHTGRRACRDAAESYAAQLTTTARIAVDPADSARHVFPDTDQEGDSGC